MTGRPIYSPWFMGVAAKATNRAQKKRKIDGPRRAGEKKKNAGPGRAGLRPVTRKNNGPARPISEPAHQGRP